MVSRSARFSPARRRARYGPVQGGSRGRWASASSVRRPGFKPRTHDWASSVVPGTPRIRQNPRDGMYVGGRYASPCLFYLFFRLPFSSASFFRPLPRHTGPPYIRSAAYVRVPTRIVLTFSLQLASPCLNARASPSASTSHGHVFRYFMDISCNRFSPHGSPFR